MSEEELDEAKLGSHSVDTTPVEPLKEDDSEETEFDARFQIETEAVFKRLARDIYESDSAGIREPLTNAITAILRAVEYDQIDADEGVVEIKVEDSGDGIQLTMRDNGVGMTMERIQKIVAVIGASEARDMGDLAGQFGMGFLAVFRLVGIDGGFEMHTNPRYSDEGPISGIWKSGGFTRDTRGLMSEEFDDDEYGTKFNFIVKDEISRREIRNWVEEYAEWARVPVVYEEVENGRTDFEENYGGFNKTITSNYDESRPVVEFENEYIQAASSPESDNRTILLDVPCQRKGGSITTILGGVDIRLKDENGVVMKGPHKGKMVVSDGEFDGMDEERQQKYIPEKNVTSDDIVLPQPTGTRRVLERKKRFWNWVEQKLHDKLIAKVNDVMEGVNDYDDLMSLDEPEFRLICYGASEKVSRRYSGGFDADKDGIRVEKWFNRNTDVTLDSRLAKQMACLVYSIRHAPEGTSNISKKRSLSRKQPAVAVYRAYNNDGDVYMGCRLSEDKAKVVWEDSDYNYVFRVESTDHYETYEDLLGWEQMKDITKDNIDNFDISESTKAEFLDVEEDELSQRTTKSTPYKLKLHFKGSSKYTKDITISDLKDKLEESDGEPLDFGRRTADRIIVFPSHKDRNISNNYWACDSRNPMTRCRKKDWVELKEFSQVQTLDQRIEDAKKVSFNTSRGEYTLEQFDNEYSDNYQVMFHVVDEPYRSRFAEDDLIEHGEQFVNKEYGVGDVKYVYAPVSPQKYREMKPVVVNHALVRGDFGTGVSVLSKRTKEGGVKRVYHIRNDTRFYAYLRLNEWTDTKEYKSFYRDVTRTTLDSGGYDLVETLRSGFESGAFSGQKTTVEEQVNN